MLDACGHGPKPGGRSAPDNFVGQRRGCNVDVARRHAEQRVADGTTDDTGFLAVAVEHREHGPRWPARERERRGRTIIGHRCTPGTRRPFSVCAGT